MAKNNIAMANSKILLKGMAFSLRNTPVFQEGMTKLRLRLNCLRWVDWRSRIEIITTLLQLRYAWRFESRAESEHPSLRVSRAPVRLSGYNSLLRAHPH